MSNGLSFTLDAPLTVQRVAATATSLATLSVDGLGIFSGAGFDPTTDIATFNMASGSGLAAGSIPEPSSLALLGGSLRAIGMIGRRRKN